MNTIHARLISAMEYLGIPVSPYMYYWTLDELRWYFNKHMASTPKGH